MTAAYLKTLAVILSNEVVLVIAITLCHSVYAATDSSAISNTVEESLCCINVG